jgi:hypothetical protein
MSAMFAFDKVPEDTESLLSIDRKIAAQAHAFLGEIQMKVRPAPVVLEMVMMAEERTKSQPLLRALFRQHMSMVLRLCKADADADHWQQDSLGVFSKDDRFLDRASLLSHALADRCFVSKRYTQAEIWANRSIKEAERAGKVYPWLADAWRISAQALSDDNLGPEVEKRLRKSVSLWNEQREPDPIRGMFAHMGLGMYLLELGKLKEADAAFVEAVVFAKLLPANAQYLADAPVAQLIKLRRERI